MKTKFLLIVLLCLPLIGNAKKIQYVTQNGAGKKDGSAWSHAREASKLQLAFDEISKTGGQVWVAEGIYKPTEGTNRDIYYSIGKNVEVYGSFKGNETSIYQRKRFDLDSNGTIEKWEYKHPSILSGNIGDLSDSCDNSNLLLLCKTLNENTFINGFTIQDCFSTSPEYNYATVNNCYLKNSVIRKNRMNQAGGSNNCHLEYCKISDNVSAGTGGVFKSTLYHCKLTNNEGSDCGGAMSSTLLNCILDKNTGGYTGVGGAHECMLSHCKITGNQSYSKGGGARECKIEYCELSGNTGEEGDICDCQLAYSSIKGSRGGARNSILRKCVIAGSLLYNSTIERCLFKNDGACIKSQISNSLFMNSYSLWLDENKFENCIITQNKTVDIFDSDLTNCLITHNGVDKGEGLGGVYTFYVNFMNCNIVKNSGSYWGMLAYSKLKNCIVWGNKYTYCILEKGDEITYSAIQDSLNPYPGIGNIMLDTINAFGPRFKKPYDTLGYIFEPENKAKAFLANWRLKKNSPCIDAGNNEYVKTKTDLDGAKRIRGKSVDMGCYEYRNRFFWWSKNKSMGIQQSDIMEYMLSGPFLLPGETEQPCPFKEAGSDKTQMHEENPVSGKYNVYPSIFTEEVNIKATSTEKYSIRIFNLSGELKYRKDNLTGGETINAGPLPSSVYQLIIETESGKVYPFGIIKE